MTTPRDLLIVALGEPAGRRPAQGDLSLALAGAELIDLLRAQSAALDGERIVPGYRPAVTDRLLDEAAGALVQQEPYELVEDWLWRRGRGLYTAYLTALEADGQLTRERRGHWKPFRAGELVLTESPARRAAADRWAADEPVLVALAAALGIGAEPAGDPRSEGLRDDGPPAGEAVETVLAAVHDALSELGYQRQRHAIDQAAFDNIWRGGDG
ncbi:GPP34 family phosphoprotein [Streptomyces sp. NPDC059649]|uniref:GOLPH3/VPS74 family protein n=1 Tax=Streptomyces sp. NPDC059649 TaxID=3346895 RepID=UPI0036A939EF